MLKFKSTLALAETDTLFMSNPNIMLVAFAIPVKVSLPLASS
jgi:hypothetical protein